MCFLQMGPLAQRDAQNISDPQMDCGSFIDENLWMRILILDRYFFDCIVKAE